MNKLSLLTIIFFLTIVSFQKSNAIIFDNVTTKDSIVFIVFKARSFKSDTIRFKNGEYSFKDDNLLYSIKGDFIEHIVIKKNYKKDDTLKIKTNRDIIFSHGCNVNQYSLYQFKPGDTVVFDYPDDHPRCKILNRKVLQNDLNFISDLNLKSFKYNVNEFQFFLENKRVRTIKEKEKLNKESFEFRTTKFDSVQKLDAFSRGFYDLIKSDIGYLYGDKSAENILNNNIDLSIPNGRNLVVKSFEKIYKPIFISSQSNSFIDSRIQLESLFSEKNISIPNKDFLMYKYILDLFMNFSKEDINKYFELVKSRIKNQEALIVISNKFLIANNNQLDFASMKLEDRSKRKYDLKKLIKTKYRNKVVYVDFWASWCGPCIAEMEESKNLRNKYKGKDVIFVYVSIDKNYKKWVDASNKEKIFEYGNDFIGLNYPDSNFYKEIQLTTIPRHLIFDRNGELVHKNAPAPSSGEIEVLLDKYDGESNKK